MDLEVFNGTALNAPMLNAQPTSSVTLIRVVIRDMVTTGTGAAIYAGSGSIGKLSNVTFIRCISASGATSGGSAIFADGPMSWTMEDVSFIDCSTPGTPSVSYVLLSMLETTNRIVVAGQIRFSDGTSSSTPKSYFMRIVTSNLATTPFSIISYSSNPAHWVFEGARSGIEFYPGTPLSFNAATVRHSHNVAAASSYTFYHVTNIPVTLNIQDSLGSSITIKGGCASINGGLEVQLTPEEVEEIANSSRQFGLISQNSTCPSLSIAVSASKTGKSCHKIDSTSTSNQEDGSKITLVAVFKINSSGCNLKWIILGSVLGGVSLLVAIFALLATFHPKVKTVVRPFWVRNGAGSASKLS